jgi:hypothetical protein
VSESVREKYIGIKIDRELERETDRDFCGKKTDM